MIYIKRAVPVLGAVVVFGILFQMAADDHVILPLAIGAVCALPALLIVRLIFAVIHRLER